jgi:hypothetical protein
MMYLRDAESILHSYGEIKATNPANTATYDGASMIKM